MKIYYMRVKTIKGVAVSWETEKPLGLLEKRLRIEEVTLPEDVRVGSPRSAVSTRNRLSDSEPTGAEKECEERAEPYSPSGSAAVQERPRAKTPDWLVTMEAGFRCMACCRVFPTLEILRQHVRYGVQEGFSCHVFHLTMAQMMGDVESESTTEEEVEEEERRRRSKEQRRMRRSSPRGKTSARGDRGANVQAACYILRRTGSEQGLGLRRELYLLRASPISPPQTHASIRESWGL